MNLDLLAIDFKGTNFCSNEKCAIAKAAKRLFPNAKLISEGVTELRIINKNHKTSDYKHMLYTSNEFDIDKAKAKKAKYSLEIIRTIQLIKTS